MTLIRQPKRRIVAVSATNCTMGQVATCFRTAELDDTTSGALRVQPLALKDDQLFGIKTCPNDECYSDDSWSDEGAWSDEDDDSNSRPVISNDLWNSFSCTNIPYANEFIETQITIANVRLANEKSEQTYSSIIQITRARSVKKVQFCPEPNLVTIIA